MVKCEICEEEYKNFLALSSHLRRHKISSKEYYDKYLKKEGEGICLKCGIITNYNKLSKGYRRFCSVKCIANYYCNSSERKEKFKNTYFKKTGYDHPSKNPNIKEKKKKTSLINWGVDNPNKSNIIRNKIELTCLKKYGYKTPLQNDKIKNKIKETNIKNYGVDNPLKSVIIQEKQKNTNLYRYGVKYVSQNVDIKNKQRQIYLKNFIPLLNKQLEYLDLELLDKKYNNEHCIYNWKCLKCNIIFKQRWNNIQQGYICPNCYPKIFCYSKGEKELLKFIKSLDLEVIENDKIILDGKELDIYIPSKNIAIEFDGLYYHSEKFGKDKYYHLNKTRLCEKQNIQLIHIFEDEWIFKKEIVKSRLKQILGINDSQRIHARKCQIKEISPKLKNEFLNKFHIQGEDKSNIKLGAFYNNELVSVMTFSKGNISKGSKYQENVWELNRFCSNNSYHIPGIASRFLAYFKRNYEWKEIFSYADRRWSIGNLYKQIGFKLDSITKPNYWYLDHLNRIHRFNLRKRTDEPKDIPEWVLRAKEGYHRIWDCGHLKFII